MYAIELEDLRRTYTVRSGFLGKTTGTVEALKGMSFHVREGELFGLLGPNGAGKTTTIKILTTLLLPSVGRARVLGRDVVREVQAVRQSIGFAFGGDRGLYGRVSARDNLRYFANLYGLHPAHARRRINEVLEQMGLAERAGDRVETFSRGMKQRLHIARALLHQPRLLFLDEPTIGIDPVGARELREAILDLKAGGTTILLTTHYMFEADVLCDRIGIINGGHLVALDTPKGLRSQASDLFVFEIEVFGSSQAAVNEVRKMEGIEALTVQVWESRHLVTVQSRYGQEALPRIIRMLGERQVGKVVVREPTLEDAYIRIITSGSPDSKRAVPAREVN